MTWAGTQTITYPAEGVIEITSDGFDANSEVGTVIDIFDSEILLKNQPNVLSIYAITTHATAVTDIVDIAVQGSSFGTRYADIGTSITDADEDNGGSDEEDSLEIITDISGLNYRYFKVFCTTVGAGNTITLYWRLSHAL